MTYSPYSAIACSVVGATQHSRSTVMAGVWPFSLAEFR